MLVCVHVYMHVCEGWGAHMCYGAHVGRTDDNFMKSVSPSTFLWVQKIRVMSADLSDKCLFPLTHIRGPQGMCDVDSEHQRLQS